MPQPEPDKFLSTPMFETWSRGNLNNFARDVYIQLRKQDDENQTLRREVKRLNQLLKESNANH